MFYNRPCAAAPWLSYRYKGRYGYIMIGAKDDTDALREAQRSTSDAVSMDNLERWIDIQYIKI